MAKVSKRQQCVY